MEKGKETEEKNERDTECFVHLNDYKNVISGILMRSWEHRKNRN